MRSSPGRYGVISVDESSSSGEETSTYAALTTGGVRNNYNTSYVDLTQTSLSAVPEYHRTGWKGRAYDAREAVASSGIRVRTGRSTAFSLIVNWSYSV